MSNSRPIDIDSILDYVAAQRLQGMPVSHRAIVDAITQTRSDMSGEALVHLPPTALGAGASPPDPITRAPCFGYKYKLGDDSRFAVRPPLQSSYLHALHISWACNENYAENQGIVKWQVNCFGQSMYHPSFAGRIFTSDDIPIPALALQLNETVIPCMRTMAGDEAILNLIRISPSNGASPMEDPVVYQTTAVFDGDGLRIDLESILKYLAYCRQAKVPADRKRLVEMIEEEAQ